ncbi:MULTISPECIES: malonic semialdehyde reductase [Cellulomonas]|uniref:malonic semialdehyde reductase n=1 Tax=Cellulomonas TaxID=1707 RepID=UPI000AF2BF1F|nr:MULTISPECIES: malonic semialdehyde reductase [Cellulomonas]UCN15678.1 malonic semialdehyde reductase [Cellulomonas iranensis]
MTTSDLMDDIRTLRTTRGVDATTADRVFRDARTVGSFLDVPVPDELLREVYDTVRWGPTAMNTSPLRLLVVRSREGRERLAPHVAEFNRDRVLAAPVTLVVATDVDFHEHMATLVPHAPTSGEGFADKHDARVAMSRDNAWLQMGYLVVGLRAAGLGVGPMTGLDAAGVDGEFFAGSAWRTLAVLNVGWPDGEGTDRPRAPRLEWDQAARTV